MANQQPPRHSRASTPARMEVVEGMVEAVNDRDVRVNGTWYKVSKYHAIELPQRGARVQLGVDTRGFILEVTMSDSRNKPAPPSAQVTAPATPVATSQGSDADKAVRCAVCGAAIADPLDVWEIRSREVRHRNVPLVSLDVCGPCNREIASGIDRRVAAMRNRQA